MKHISVKDLKKKIDNGNNLILIDVREPRELAMASLENAIHIPMMAIPNRTNDLDMDKPVAVMCHTGMRSMQVCMYLNQLGFDAYNVKGGIHAWSIEVDPSVPTY